MRMTREAEDWRARAEKAEAALDAKDAEIERLNAELETSLADGVINEILIEERFEKAALAAKDAEITRLQAEAAAMEKALQGTGRCQSCIDGIEWVFSKNDAGKALLDERDRYRNALECYAAETEWSDTDGSDHVYLVNRIVWRGHGKNGFDLAKATLDGKE